MSAGRLHRLRDAAGRISRDHALLAELFATANLGFLVLDVVIAHSVNAFGDPLEWAPVVFAAAAAIALLVNLLRAGGRGRRFDMEAGRTVGLAVGWGAIVIGVGGLALHLDSRFFIELTLRSLVYSAPFAAPLAFAGLGFLVLLNRLVEHDSADWGSWVIVLALGGFVGNFVLALVDHAQNGFFHLTEWIPVGAAALAIGALGVAIAFRVDRGFLRFLLGVLALEIVVALVGFGLHLAPLLRPTSATWADRVVFGPPPFAPLLFADLALLAMIGAAALRRSATPSSRATPP